jgi:hypothetical protein
VTALKLTVTNWGEVQLDKRELKNLMRSAGNDVKTKTARLISKTSGSGRTYPGGGGSAYRGAYRPGAYRASAPGDPPVTVSGSLRQSLKVIPYASGEGFAVRERQYYSLFLEAGARGGGNFGRGRAQRMRGQRHRRGPANSVRVLQPRPHLDRVMQQEEPNLQRRVRQALDEGLRWKETKR